MRKFSRLVCWLTLWVDVCLIAGVIFTERSAGHRISAEISFGAKVSSFDKGGSIFILVIAVWTAFLAICALRSDHGKKKDAHAI
jgi:hypothetical protein